VLRSLITMLVCWLATLNVASAQDWAAKMFSTTAHDFGNVARGSKAQFRFQIKNLYEEDLVLGSVTSSCNCTVPQLTKSHLKTFETADIVAEFNTRDFLGQRSATLTVKCQIPSRADIPPAFVQLKVKGVIRSDIVVQPGLIELGTVDEGKGVERTLLVTYAGRPDWKILDVKTADPHFEVEVTELTRLPGKVSYSLLVRLTKDAPVGYVKDQLILVTTDPQAREFPVEMQGRVITDITISNELFFGVVPSGKKVSKKLVVRGRKPFKIIDVKCADKSFEIEPDTEAKVMHVLPVVFTAGDDPGRVVEKISILTDQSNTEQVCTAFAEIVKPKQSEPSEAAEPSPQTSDEVTTAEEDEPSK
jgi:hypothetical protein